MGTVDIEKELGRFEIDERIIYDDSIPFNEFSNLIKDVITEVTERYYEIGEDEGEIEDWDMWEMDIITECNDRVEKLLES